MDIKIVEMNIKIVQIDIKVEPINDHLFLFFSKLVLVMWLQRSAPNLS